MFKQQQDILTQIHQLEREYRRSYYLIDKKGNISVDREFASSVEAEYIHDLIARLQNLNTYIRRILDRPWSRQ